MAITRIILALILLFGYAYFALNISTIIQPPGFDIQCIPWTNICYPANPIGDLGALMIYFMTVTILLIVSGAIVLYLVYLIATGKAGKGGRFGKKINKRLKKLGSKK
jgi:hypothetical protein